MTQAELKARLDASGLPIAYREWPAGEAPPLPWAVYYHTTTEPFAADGRVYCPMPRYRVELYARRKDPAAEAAMEAALAPFVWDKAETAVPEEKMTMVSYEFDI